MLVNFFMRSILETFQGRERPRAEKQQNMYPARVYQSRVGSWKLQSKPHVFFSLVLGVFWNRTFFRLGWKLVLCQNHLWIRAANAGAGHCAVGQLLAGAVSFLGTKTCGAWFVCFVFEQWRNIDISKRWKLWYLLCDAPKAPHVLVLTCGKSSLSLWRGIGDIPKDIQGKLGLPNTQNYLDNSDSGLDKVNTSARRAHITLYVCFVSSNMRKELKCSPRQHVET